MGGGVGRRAESPKCKCQVVGSAQCGFGSLRVVPPPEAFLVSAGQLPNALESLLQSSGGCQKHQRGLLGLLAAAEGPRKLL